MIASKKVSQTAHAWHLNIFEQTVYIDFIKALLVFAVAKRRHGKPPEIIGNRGIDTCLYKNVILITGAVQNGSAHHDAVYGAFFFFFFFLIFFRPAGIIQGRFFFFFFFF